jgi:hypothetical protein
MAEGFVYSDRLMPTSGIAETAKDFASAYTAKQKEVQAELKTKEQQALADLKAAKAQSDQYLKQSYKYDIAALPEFAREEFNGFLEEKRDEISDLLNESSEFSIGEAEKVISQISNMYNQIKGAIPESVTYQLDLQEALVDPAKLSLYNQQLGDFANAEFNLQKIGEDRSRIFVKPEFKIVDGQPKIGEQSLQDWTADLSLIASDFGPTINQVSPSDISAVAQSISDDMRSTKMDWDKNDAKIRTESLFKGKATEDQKRARYALISALGLKFDSNQAKSILDGTWNQDKELKTKVQEQIDSIVDMSKYGKAKTTTSKGTTSNAPDLP